MGKKDWTDWKIVIFCNFTALANLGVLIVMPIILLVLALKFHENYLSNWAFRAKYNDIF
jgi:hypothetical protein